ncbi:hypothetical protein ACOMHN_036285 [Nucella lapillus]
MRKIRARFDAGEINRNDPPPPLSEQRVLQHCCDIELDARLSGGSGKELQVCQESRKDPLETEGFWRKEWTWRVQDVPTARSGFFQKARCTGSTPTTVGATIPPPSSSSSSSYTGCNVTVSRGDSGSSGGLLNLHYTVLRFSGSSDECGVSLWIYENPQSGTNTPNRKLTCMDTGTLPIQSSSVRGTLKFAVVRDTTQNSDFRLQIKVTGSGDQGYGEVRNTARLTDSGGGGGGQTNDPTPTNDEGEGGGGLNIGVVVGIVIAAVILIIALIGIAIYCCLKNRDEELKNAEAYEGRSGTSVFTSGTSQVLFAGGNNQRKSGGKYGSMEDVRSSSDKGSNLYSNKGYHADDDDERRDNSGYPDRGVGFKNTAFVDEADRAVERGGHLSRRDSGRGVKYDKKKNYSRHEEYEMSKVSKVPNGILKTRSKSPNRSQSSTEGSTVDSKAMVYGYSQTTHAHPNTQHIPVLERTRSRSRSRGTSSHRSGSAGRSRSGSVGKSAGKDIKPPKSARQYSDMSHFLDKPKERPRSRSGSLGKRSRSDSKTSENNTPSEVSFAASGASSKRNTGGRRVHIQGVETDF